MTHSLAIRSRHSSRKEATRQIIVFSLRQERFALPIQVAQRVVAINNLYGYTPDSDIGLMLYQNQEIPVINLDRRIFGSAQNLLPANVTDDSPPPRSKSFAERYLLMIQNLQGEVVGLPIATQPMLHRVPESAFAPLSPTYLSNGNIRCVSALIILAENEPPIFLLNLNQLLPQTMLPSSNE